LSVTSVTPSTWPASSTGALRSEVESTTPVSVTAPSFGFHVDVLGLQLPIGGNRVAHQCGELRILDRLIGARGASPLFAAMPAAAICKGRPLSASP
jgi:hypothetical protein